MAKNLDVAMSKKLKARPYNFKAIVHKFSYSIHLAILLLKFLKSQNNFLSQIFLEVEKSKSFAKN